MVECAERCWEIMVNPYLTGDKGTRMDEHGPKSRILIYGQKEKNGMRTKKYTHTDETEVCIGRAVSGE